MSALARSPAEAYAPTVARVRAAIGAHLRSLFLFGSCVSGRARHATSIPDLFAVVDDVDATLLHLGAGTVARVAARALPPITLAFRAADDGAPLAKLNVIEPGVVEHELAALHDLYLAGRLSKRVEVVYTRDATCESELAALLDHAAVAMVGVALLAPPSRAPISSLVERCVKISYEAEPRPERAHKIQALFDAHAAHYHARFRPLVEREATRRGLTIVADEISDPRDAATRRREARARWIILWRSRLRMIARWPKQALVYRGWLSYLVQKLWRARLPS
jgi:hypothetical protein